jgi:hypothetical protein
MLKFQIAVSAEAGAVPQSGSKDTKATPRRSPEFASSSSSLRQLFASFSDF